MRKQSRSKPHTCHGSQANQRVVIGLTGSFGSGKSTVAGIFRSLGVEIIDADKLAHCLIMPGRGIYKRIIRAFGKGILREDKTIDRNRLADIVFNDRDALKALDRIVHPQVIAIIKNKIKASHHKVIVLDAPLLIEAGLTDVTDKLVVVKASRKKQIERIRKKTSLSKTDILKRIKQQVPLRKKLCLADFVIDNNGSVRETKKQVEQIRRQLWIN
jgi:dephospho-CoA kinase